MTGIKICGTTNSEDAQASVAAGADALGFIFAPSPRQIDPSSARDLVAALPKQVEKVGVFVNESAERIREIVEQAGLTAVQLHGEESPEFAAKLFQSGDSPQPRTPLLRLFKTIQVGSGFEAELRAFAEVRQINGVLLDSGSGSLRGGTGRTFDWRRTSAMVPAYPGDLRIIMAGGLDPSNVGDAIGSLRPWGVDVCSGVEREPGKKDPEKLRSFVTAVRKTEKKSLSV